MLRVRTRIGRSAIHGLGLFAAERIAAGTLIWAYDPEFDVAFTAESLASLSEPARQQVEKYAYFERQLGAYVLCGDDARFMNHSTTPNTLEDLAMRTVAARPIAIGEEITCDYACIGAEDPHRWRAPPSPPRTGQRRRDP